MGAVEQLVYAIVFAAERQQARFIRIADGHVQFLIAGTWHYEISPPRTLFDPIVRRFAVMIGVLAPGPEQTVAGGLAITVAASPRVFCRVAIEHRGRLSVLVELVTESELAERVRPELPSTHPHRS